MRLVLKFWIFFETLLFYGIWGQSTIQVVWMIPKTSHLESSSSYLYNASSSVAALALGLETIQNESILPDHVLNVTYLDTDCNSKQSLGALVDLLFQQTIDVVLGPPCSEVVLPVGQLMSYRNTLIMNWVSTGQTVVYKNDLTTYIRTMSPISSLGGIMIQFFYYTGWKRLVIISSEGDEYIAGAQTIEDALKFHESKGFHIAHHYDETKTNASESVIDNILSSIIHEARIIVMLIPRDELRKYMLRAHYLGMTSGDYQFLFTGTQLAGAEDVALFNSDKLWSFGDGYDAEARQAFENVLYFVLGHNMEPVAAWRDSAMQAYTNVFGGRTDIPTPSEPDDLSAYVHDTIVYYARLLNKTLSYNDTTLGSDMFKYAGTVFIRGLSGDVVMGKLGDRQPAFFVYDMSTTGNFHKVANLQYAIKDDLSGFKVSSLFTQIIWGDGQTTDDPYIPPDRPSCGFYNEFCTVTTSSKSYDSIIIGVSVAMLLVFLGLFLIYRWWRGEQDLKNMAWKINPNDLIYNTNKKIHSPSYLSAGLSSNGSMGSTGVQGTIRRGATSTHSITRGQIFTTVAEYKGQVVAVKKSTKKKISIDRSFMMLMKNLSTLKHANLTAFVGISTEPEKICSVWEYCSKGSIQDVIENDDIKLDTMFKLSIAIDICQGLEYLHKSPIKHHGNMKSSNCVIDSRWVCKLTDFAVLKLKPSNENGEETLGKHAYYARLFWTAPEHLRCILKKESVQYTTQADIYALGIIIKELSCRNEPYCMESHLSPKEIITSVANPENPEVPFRPEISDTELDSEYRRTNLEYLIHRCWAEDPDNRPTMKGILRTLNKINPYKKSTVVDNMILMMEKYTNNLEDIVAERTEQLQEEKRKTDALLYRMLPRKVADDLKVGRSIQAEAFDSVTIYFSDIVQFTNLASESTPLEIVALLNSLYTQFDDIISHHDVYKVETIGDAYMIVSGLPERNGNLHVKEMAWVALNILRSVLTFVIPHKTGRQLEIRIGLHTGPVVAGVVGLTMPRYCLFGDTVNTASRMESNGKPQRIHVSPQSKKALEDFPNFIVDSRGEILIKGKGMMTTYWLSGIYEPDENLGVEPEQFQRLIKPEQSAYSDDDGANTKALAETTNISEGFQGKISVADSGIGMDKGHDERNTFMGSDGTGSSDGMELHKAVGDEAEEVWMHRNSLDDKSITLPPRSTALTNECCHSDVKDDDESNDYGNEMDNTMGSNKHELNYKRSPRRNNFLTTNCPQEQTNTDGDNAECHAITENNDTARISIDRPENVHDLKRTNAPHESHTAVVLGSLAEDSESESGDESPCVKKKDRIPKTPTKFTPPTRLFATNFMKVQNNWVSDD